MTLRKRAEEAAGRVCADNEGWCPANPDTPDSEVDPRNGRRCGKASGIADAIEAQAKAFAERVLRQYIDRITWPKTHVFDPEIVAMSVADAIAAAEKEET